MWQNDLLSLDNFELRWKQKINPKKDMYYNYFWLVYNNILNTWPWAKFLKWNKICLNEKNTQTHALHSNPIELQNEGLKRRLLE